MVRGPRPTDSARMAAKKPALLTSADAPPGLAIGSPVIAEKTDRCRNEERIWTEKIHSAVREDRLVLYAQPIVRTDDLVPVMHELLVRMRTPSGLLMPPAAFLPQAEHFGLVGLIDRWVVAEGLEMARSLPVSINVSALTLADPGFGMWAVGQLAGLAAPPGNVVFEITETAALGQINAASAVLDRLSEAGCGLALDDFGTGYGTFAHLRDLPVSFLKIDRSFIRRVSSSHADQLVVKALVGVAKTFGVMTIAEGVEDQETMEFLELLDVDLLQGFFLGHPRPFSGE